MSNRSADAGILGFTYQFIQTAIKILEVADYDAVFTIEGIEDLDISTAKEEELVQYKYHSAKKFTLSAIQKPIALMFKHFEENYVKEKPWNTKYTLFCYFGIGNFETPNNNVLIKTTEELNKILNYTEAQSILVNKEWDVGLAEEFLKHLNFSNADEFEDAKAKLIDIIEQNFSINKVESEMMFLSNAIFRINELAIKKEVDSRQITKRRFIDYLTENSQKNEAAIIERIYGRAKYINLLKNYLSIKNIKPNTKSHIFYLSRINYSTPRVILDLVKKFHVSGKKNDIKPITFIINSEGENIKKLKEELSKINVLENLDLIFNDGDEDYYFNPSFFNKPPLIRLQRNKQKIDLTSYNYRLISHETYKLNHTKVSFDHPFHILMNNSESNLASIDSNSTINKLNLKNLSEHEIMQLFGG
ncbi:hypothetical protein [Bacillus mycoides]